MNDRAEWLKDAHRVQSRQQEGLEKALAKGREHLMQTSPFFALGVRTLAAMLPMWVTAIAAQAETEDEMVRMAIRHAGMSGKDLLGGIDLDRDDPFGRME